MPFQRVPNTAEVKLIYGYGSGPDINNVVHVRHEPSSWGEANLDTLLDAIETWWNADIKPLQHSALSLRTLRAVDLDGPYGQRHERSIAVAGTRAGAAAPAVIAPIIKFVGDAGDPPRRGLLYHAGVAEADVDHNDITSQYATDLRDGYAALSAAISAANGDWALVLVSRYEGSNETPSSVEGSSKIFRQPIKRGTAVTNTISSVSVPTRYGVQRRRRSSPL